MELDEVQSNRSELIGKIRESVRVMVDNVALLLRVLRYWMSI